MCVVVTSCVLSEALPAMALTVEDYLKNEKFVKRISESFSQLDRNKNGYVSRDDYQLSIDKLAKLVPDRPEVVAKARKIAAEFCDAFGLTEGVRADKEKLVQLAAAMGIAETGRMKRGEETLTSKVHNAVLDIVDQNHDGHVTLAEYKMFMEASDHKPDVAEATFKALDKNKNGKIERKELINEVVKFWCDLDDQDTK